MSENTSMGEVKKTLKENPKSLLKKSKSKVFANEKEEKDFRNFEDEIVDEIMATEKMKGRIPQSLMEVLSPRVDEKILESEVDVVNTKISKILQTAIRKDRVAHDRVEYLLRKFEELHVTYLETERRESTLLIKNRQLHNELKNLRSKTSSRSGQKSVLKKNLEELQVEKKKAYNQQRISDKQRKNNLQRLKELREKVQYMEDKLKKRKNQIKQKAAPILQDINFQIMMMKQQLNVKMFNCDKLKKEKNHILREMKKSKNSITDFVLHQIQERRHFLELLRKKPPQERKNYELITLAVGGLRNQMISREETQVIKEENIEDLKVDKERIIEQNKELGNKLEQKTRSRLTLEQKIKSYQETNNVEKEIARKLNEVIVKREHDLESNKNQIRSINNQVRLQKKEHDREQKKIENIEKRMVLATKTSEGYQKKLDEIEKEKKKYVMMMEKYKEEIMTLEDDVDMKMQSFLNYEKYQDSVNVKIKDKMIEMKKIDNNMDRLLNNEKKTEIELQEKGMERERMARESMEKKKLFVKTMGEMKVHKFQNNELKKKLSSLKNEFKSLSRSYSKLKKKRNKFGTLLQENSQTLTQLQVNRNMLLNENEVLSRKCFDKEMELIKVRKLHMRILDNQEKSKQQLSTSSRSLESVLNKIDDVDAELVKLQNEIDTKENDMVKLKYDFDGIIEERNNSGVKLVDRNDELCILYEKSTMQKNVVKKGELQLIEKKKILNVLQRDVDSLQRDLKSGFAKLPEILALDKEKKSLMFQLKKNRMKTDELSEKVETPIFNVNETVDDETKLDDSKKRKKWRILNSKIPSEQELRERNLVFEEKLLKLNEKKNEKSILLKEITSTTNNLQESVNKSHRSYELSIAINDIKNKINSETRKIKALLSEISVYQSKSIVFGAKNKNLENYLLRCNKLMENNERIEEWDEDWERIQDDKARRRHMKERRKIEKMRTQMRELQNENEVVKTTAIQRPNSYFPNDGVGIPKPYFMKPVLPIKLKMKQQSLLKKQRMLKIKKSLKNAIIL